MTKAKRPQQTPSLQGILGVAHDFYIGAGVLYRRIEDALSQKTDNNEVAPGSFVILATLHLELMMKALLVVRGKPTVGHNLIELYDELPTAEQTELERAYDTGRSAGNALGLRGALEHYKTAFVNWRYAYESNPDTLQIVPLKDVIRVVTARVNELRTSIAPGSS